MEKNEEFEAPLLGYHSRDISVLEVNECTLDLTRAASKDSKAAAPAAKTQEGSIALLLALNFAIFWVYSQKTLPAPFLANYLAGRGISGAGMGILFGIFPLCGFVAAPAAGIVVLRFGAVLCLGGSLLAMATADVLLALFRTFAAILVLRAVLGAMCSLFTSATFTLLARHFPHNLAWTIGIVETVLGTGCLTGRCIGGFLYQIGGFPCPFLAQAALLVMSAAYATLLLKRAPLHPSSSAASVQPIADQTTDAKHKDTAAVEQYPTPDVTPSYEWKGTPYDVGADETKTGYIASLEPKPAEDDHTPRKRFPRFGRGARRGEGGPSEGENSPVQRHGGAPQPRRAAAGRERAGVGGDERHGQRNPLRQIGYIGVLRECPQTLLTLAGVALTVTCYSFYDPILAPRLNVFFGPLPDAAIGAITAINPCNYTFAAVLVGKWTNSWPAYGVVESLGFLSLVVGYLLLGPCWLLLKMGIGDHSIGAWVCLVASLTLIPWGEALSFVPAIPWMAEDAKHLGGEAKELLVALCVSAMSLGEGLGPVIGGVFDANFGFSSACTLQSFIYLSFMAIMLVVRRPFAKLIAARSTPPSVHVLEAPLLESSGPSRSPQAPLVLSDLVNVDNYVPPSRLYRVLSEGSERSAAANSHMSSASYLSEVSVSSLTDEVAHAGLGPIVTPEVLQAIGSVTSAASYAAQHVRATTIEGDEESLTDNEGLPLPEPPLSPGRGLGQLGFREGPSPEDTMASQPFLSPAGLYRTLSVTQGNPDQNHYYRPPQQQQEGVPGGDTGAERDRDREPDMSLPTGSPLPQIQEGVRLDMRISRAEESRAFPSMREAGGGEGGDEQPRSERRGWTADTD
ncbi:unnamed protein product [Vitrella brassicaformis CCMP3155]|uniref:Major facilitator superfamily (MFS) profile domain-containing protein n=1 Tax=Vitrella brassicaformis (strain CCMP3155) TaxID=1169540 RepID=A0A0G4EH85_VITBC|nr:unnamed protein product [Vitrella brassicaformis CCMP3155]|eukprot:CEL94739.1 unnamed protein product [Vitrella brassicaformis CCMP3155]